MLTLSISNWMSCFRSFHDSKWSFQNFYQMYFGKIRGVVGDIHSPITLGIKKGTRTSDYESNEPPPKITRSPLSYPCPERWGMCRPEDIIFGPFNYVKPNSYQNFYRMCLGKWWAWEGLVTLQSLSTIKKGTGSFNLQSNELFSKFVRKNGSLFEKSQNFCQIQFRKIWGVGEGIHPLITLNLRNGLRTLITNPLSLLLSLYDRLFYVYLICSQGITYNPWPWGLLGGGLSSKT